MAQIFKVNDHIEIVCETVGTRYGFRHDARLFVKGQEYGKKAKACYYNRTWEKFTYETVIHLLLEKTDALTEPEKEQFRTKLNNKYGY
jgi:hypothetical protein